MNRWICSDLARFDGTHAVLMEDVQQLCKKINALASLREKIQFHLYGEECILVRYNCKNRMEVLFKQLEEYVVPMKREFLEEFGEDNGCFKVMGLTFDHDFYSFRRTEKEKSDMFRIFREKYGFENRARLFIPPSLLYEFRYNREAVCFFMVKEKYVKWTTEKLREEIRRFVVFYALYPTIYEKEKNVLLRDI